MQGASESVDNFAQELCRLHSKAYSTLISVNSEAKRVRQLVLVNQFVSGLLPELQTRGGMNEIFAKARFEEAKLKEFSRQGAETSRSHLLKSINPKET